MSYFARTMRCHQSQGRCQERANLRSSNILQNLVDFHPNGKEEEIPMRKTNWKSTIHLVNVRGRVESNVHVVLMVIAVKNIVGMSIFI